MDLLFEKESPNIGWKRAALFLSFFLLVFAQSTFLETRGLASYFEYGGMAILLLGCFLFAKKEDFSSLKKHWFVALLVIVFFCLGILVQDLLIGTKVRLLISMMLLAIFAFSGNAFFDRKKCFSVIGWAVFLGSCCCALFALGSGETITVPSWEGISLGFDLTFGMQFKNLFGYTILVSLLCFSENYRQKKNGLDLAMAFVAFILLLLSNSRGALLLFVFFLLLEFLRFAPRQKGSAKYIFYLLLLALGGMAAAFFFEAFSETFAYRTRGFVNYWNYTSGDFFHLLFGNAEMAFRDSGMSYSENVRSVVGWDGTVELVFLNVLIKNGLLGFLGFGIIIFRFLKKGAALPDKPRISYFALLLPFLFSIFMEAYFANINMAYTLFNYAILNHYLNTYSPKVLAFQRSIICFLQENALLPLEEESVASAI